MSVAEKDGALIFFLNYSEPVRPEGLYRKGRQT